MVASLPVWSQQISGQAYEDRNGNGIRDAGEPSLDGVQLRLVGTASAGGALDLSTATAGDGSWSFSPGDGCYLVAPLDPHGWRASQAREDGFLPASAAFPFPVGQPRYSKLDQTMTNLQDSSFVFAAIGDSIAWNFNICSYRESFWYSKQIRSRLACVSPTTAISLDEAAIKGEHTDDLLVDEGGETNNIFRLLELQPDLVSISMIGNDLLDVDPGGGATQAEVNRAVAEVLDARQNLQEVISTLLSELPRVDITLNTLYDNEAYNCYSGGPSDFHRAWLPMVNRILRNLAWGQVRRVAINEIAAELAHEDQLADCTGYDGMICRDFFLFDTIHPTNDGFTVLREKVWEGAGGVSLGAGDALGRSSISNVDHGFLRLVRRVSPQTWAVRDGATVINPEAALDGQDGGTPARITLGAGAEELRLGGFPDWFDEIQIVRVVAGVRYRTTGTVNDDFYRVEASLDDQFRPPPGFAYTPTNWDFFTPIVGGGGPLMPAENPDYGTARLLAVPDVPNYREASALLSKNAILPPGAAEYQWPAVTHEELATTALRVVAAPVAGTPGNDGYEIELEHAWLDLYGWELPRPAEVTELRVDRLPDGTIAASFDTLGGAQRYNLYTGLLSSVQAGSYDHGASAPEACDRSTLSAGAGRLQTTVAPVDQLPDSTYYLITAHVDDVESPAGQATDGTEIDRSASTCH